MGNTRSSPYSYCVDAHAGIDADLISWDMVSFVSPLCNLLGTNGRIAVDTPELHRECTSP